MEVQMIDTRRGVNHVGLVQQYHSGQVCDMPDAQAARFLRRGWATDPNPVGMDAAVSQVLFEKAQARYAANREAWLHCFDYLKANIPAEAYTAICPAILKLTAAFRPQPTRGSVPTNPATLAARGEL